MNTPTAGSNLSTSCGTEDISKITNKKYTDIKGSQTANTCPNDQTDANNVKSTYFMSQDISSAATANAQGWYSHICYNYRASSDNAQFVKGIKVGNTIQFRAGFNIFDNANANNLVNGQAAGIKRYEIIDDGAIALAASSVVAVLAVSHMGF